ncbi:tRNA (adenosine(37)-N6)-threonylcarbamoyltransferase complex transferase subunit TsaD [Patescibacteria group bacterium]|nr:tRNA (adenosine(37)-N6)-threonylcarbamoyltransferase complex transferase subunit TsaD [Patescibacteria group bacterium]
MKILGIETSCDETAAAVVENGPSTSSGLRILSDVVASSVELHQKTGGIIPEIAAREQLKCIVHVIEEALQKTKKIDAIAVTVGPGLIGSLLVGVETAKTLAYIWKKPIVPVNHLQAHLYANWLVPENKQQTNPRPELGSKANNKVPKFPAVGLVVSGGHTDLVLMKDHGKIKWLGGTRDDAAGECFDKTARVFGLPYPGGPEIAKLAEKGNSQAYDLPRPMIKQKNLDFSFSGLKTAVINLKRKQKSISKADLAAGIQQAIIDVLVAKTAKAVERYRVKSVLLAGGVAANKELRKQMQAQISSLEPKINLFIPPSKFCTDNATYIAACAFFNFKPIPWQKIEANPGLGIAGASIDKT